MFISINEALSVGYIKIQQLAQLVAAKQVNVKIDSQGVITHIDLDLLSIALQKFHLSAKNFDSATSAWMTRQQFISEYPEISPSSTFWTVQRDYKNALQFLVGEKNDEVVTLLRRDSLVSYADKKLNFHNQHYSLAQAEEICNKNNMPFHKHPAQAPSVWREQTGYVARGRAYFNKKTFDAFVARNKDAFKPRPRTYTTTKKETGKSLPKRQKDIVTTTTMMSTVTTSNTKKKPAEVVTPVVQVKSSPVSEKTSAKSVAAPQVTSEVKQVAEKQMKEEVTFSFSMKLSKRASEAVRALFGKKTACLDHDHAQLIAALARVSDNKEDVATLTDVVNAVRGDIRVTYEG